MHTGSWMVVVIVVLVRVVLVDEVSDYYLVFLGEYLPGKTFTYDAANNIPTYKIYQNYCPC